MLQVNASEMPRIMRCFGAATALRPKALKEAQSQEMSDAAREGIAVADFLSAILKKQDVAIGMSAPNGVILTEEIFDNLSLIIQHMEELRELGYTIKSEHPSYITLDSIGVRVASRADVIAENRETGALHVVDYKNGVTPVNASENWQLITEALCYLMGGDWPPERIVFEIYQPNTYDGEPHKVEEITYPQLLEYYKTLMEKLHAWADQYRRGEYQYSSGSHCRYCAVAQYCGTLQANVADMVDFVLQSGALQEGDYGRMALELKMLERADDVLKARKSAIKSALMAYLLKGGFVPGLGLKSSLKSRAWKEGVDVRQFAEQFGVDVTKETLVTPAEAERRGLPSVILDNITERLEGHKQLTEVDTNEQF